MSLDKNQVEAIKDKLLAQLSSLPEDKRGTIKKQIEGMSSSQLESFLKQNVQMDECVFCSIIEGKTESYKVFENNNFVCVLSIRPVSEGHLLLIPKDHKFKNEEQLLKEGNVFVRVLEKTYPKKKIDTSLEKVFDHLYLSIFPVTGERTELKPTQGYFKETQRKIIEGIEEDESKVPSEELEGKAPVEQLYKTQSRIP